jgi:hypothetical protein
MYLHLENLRKHSEDRVYNSEIKHLLEAITNLIKSGNKKALASLELYGTQDYVIEK